VWVCFVLVLVLVGDKCSKKRKEIAEDYSGESVYSLKQFKYSEYHIKETYRRVLVLVRQGAITCHARLGGLLYELTNLTVAPYRT
jgi:hypothetical protein